MKDLIGKQVLEALCSPAVVKVIADAVYTAVYEKRAPDLHNSFQLEMKKSDDKINNMLIESDNLKKKVKLLETALEKQEQYSHREYSVLETPNEKTETVILDLATKMGVNLAAHDIDRSHRNTRGVPAPSSRNSIQKQSLSNSQNTTLCCQGATEEHWHSHPRGPDTRATRLVLQDAIAPEHLAYMLDGW